ncbi:MAG TPA: helix-turn-helix domain-containing protein [Thermoplasmata archaeon]|nr:helix-turn-helix domain-containing protein [Thermoplasmata archaeon]
MSENRLSLTTEERVLLYLSDFKGMEDRFGLPMALTQRSIAFAAGIHRKHVSRYLDELVAEGAVAERKAHIEGMRQRMLAYYLSGKGWERAGRIRVHLSTIRVPIRVKGEMREMALEEIDRATSVRLSFSDIVREAMAAPVLDMEYLETIDERRKREMDERLEKIEAYTKALLTAWQDGKVTATEQLLLEQLRSHLEISELDHRRIETEVITKVVGTMEDVRKTYRDLFRHAMAAGKITPKVRDVLEDARRLLRVTKDESVRIEREVESEALGS